MGDVVNNITRLAPMATSQLQPRGTTKPAVDRTPASEPQTARSEDTLSAQQPQQPEYAGQTTQRYDEQAEEAQQKQRQDGLEEIMKELGMNEPRNVKLEFDVDDELERVVVRVVDRTTGDVVREVPPEELRDVAKALRKLRNDDEKALKGNFVRVVT